MQFLFLVFLICCHLLPRILQESYIFNQTVLTHLAVTWWHIIFYRCTLSYTEIQTSIKFYYSLHYLLWIINQVLLLFILLRFEIVLSLYDELCGNCWELYYGATISIQAAVVTKEVTKKMTSDTLSIIYGCLIFFRIGKSICFRPFAIFDLLYIHTFSSEKTVGCRFAVISFFPYYWGCI